MIEKGFNQAGRGPASPLLRRALRVRRYLDMHGKHSLYWICMESKNYSLLLCHSSTIIWFKFRNDVIGRPKMGQDSPHLATPVTGAHRSRSFSLWLLVLMARSGGDMDRLALLLEKSGQSALGGDMRSRISSSSGSASGGGRGSTGGLAAGTPPDRFGADRNGSTVQEIDAVELYKVYDPAGLQKKWSEGEVARVVIALPDLRLP